MDARKVIFQETAIVAVGQLLCTCLMVGIFALLGKFDASVLLGGIAGMLLATGNFFFMALGADQAADKAVNQDVKGGQLLIRNSYMLRLAVLFTALFACAKSGIFHLFALALPLIFTRPIITIGSFLRKSGAESS